MFTRRPRSRLPVEALVRAVKTSSAVSLCSSLLIGLLVAACGTKYSCPENFVISGSSCYCPEDQGFTQVGVTCVKNEPTPDTTSTGDTLTDSTTGSDTVGGELPGTDDATDQPDVQDTVDVPIQPDVPDTSSPKKVVGAACTDDLDCLGGLQCFSWPKGYCTLTPCADTGTPCPGASQCWTGDAAMPAVCSQACDSVLDCRKADGYGCKRLSTTFGGLDANLCLPSGAAATGMGCTKSLDCAGDNTCLTDMAGGYCGRLGCSPTDPCDADSACVMRNGKFTCLKTCAADTDCAIATKQSRKCVTKSDVKKATVQVCLDSVKAAPVGSPCVADLDCDSKSCAIFAKGTCATGGAVCLTDGQCGAAAPCNIPKDGSQDKGTCSATCDTTKNCPTGGFCVDSGNSGSGGCAAKCMGPGDDASCGGVPGLVCLFGQPLVTPTGVTQPGYACAPRPAGTAGADCTATTDCAKGTNCIVNAQTTGGYCATPCANTPCPFGSVCTDMGISMCQRMCSIDEDCPPLFTCLQDNQAGTKVCKLP